MNGNSFTQLQDFGIMVDISTPYYITDRFGTHIYILNDNFDFLSMKTFSMSNYMVTINSSIYLTGTFNIWKTDNYLNILITLSDSNAFYNGIYFNCTENLIYVAPTGYTYFQVFDLNLTLNHTVRLLTNNNNYNPRSFSAYNNELYVGTF